MSDTMHKIKVNDLDHADQERSKALVCALMDGELEPQEVVRAVEDCDAKDWTAYHLIGDVMRKSDSLNMVSETFAVRMAAALEREAPHNSQAQPRSKPAHSAEMSGWRRWVTWPSFAVTAAVASVVWVAQPLFEGEPTQIASVSTPTPPASAAPAQLVSESAFRDYTEAHRQSVGPIAVQQASFMPGSSQ